MDNNRKNYTVLFIIILIILVAIGAYLFFHGSNGTEYQQGPLSVTTSSGNGSQNGSSGTSAATSSPVNLVSISPATTTVDSTITLSGSGFSFGPSQSQMQGQNINSWLNQDHVIIWLTRQNSPSSAEGSASGNNGAVSVSSILAGIGSYGVSSTASQGAGSTTAMTATSSQSGVLWQGSPGSDSDTSISFTISRFLCTQPNSEMSEGTISPADCSQLFAVTPGTYLLTVAIPYLNIVSNPLTLTITSPTLSQETYANAQYGYSLHYPDDLSVKENADYPPTPGVGVDATAFTLPKTYYPGSTVTQASVDIAVTGVSNGASENCSEWPDDQQNFPVLGTVTIDGTVFNVRQDTGLAAGNLYSTTEYSTQMGNQCYRLALYSHVGDPGAYASDSSQVAQYAAANAAAEQMFAAVFNEMAQSFVFTKTPLSSASSPQS